jgi:hypothetical protein
MELQQLRYFCAVADTNSFSRAAEQCHVSQPSLSQQILKLEDELGARLFDRLGRSVRLTELGKAFLPRARSVLHELAAAKGDVVERQQSIGGPLTIGVIPTVAPYVLPPLLASFSRKFPQVELTVAEEITPILLDRLRAGSIDLAVLALPIRGNDFESFPLLTERLFAALPKQHKLVDPLFVSPICASIPSFFSAMDTASAKLLSPPATAPASTLASFLKAGTFPVSSPWSARTWESPSSRKWPSTNPPPAASSASTTLRPLARSARFFSVDAPSPAPTAPSWRTWASISHLAPAPRPT